MLSPTIAKPIFEQLLNMNWLGNPIYKEGSDFKEAGPDHTMYFNSSREGSRTVTKWLYDNIGVDINPETIDHYMDAYLGGIFKDALDLADFTQVAIKDGDFQWDKFPIVNIFTPKSEGWGSYWLVDEMIENSRRTPYNEQEVARFYLSMERAYDSGKKEKGWMVKEIKKFRKNQHELTGVLPPKPGQSWDDPELKEEQKNLELGIVEKLEKKEEKKIEKEEENLIPITDEELEEGTDVGGTKKKKKKKKKKLNIEPVYDNTEYEPPPIEKETRKDTINWMDW